MKSNLLTEFQSSGQVDPDSVLIELTEDEYEHLSSLQRRSSDTLTLQIKANIIARIAQPLIKDIASGKWDAILVERERAGKWPFNTTHTP